MRKNTAAGLNATAAVPHFWFRQWFWMVTGSCRTTEGNSRYGRIRIVQTCIWMKRQYALNKVLVRWSNSNLKAFFFKTPESRVIKSSVQDVWEKARVWTSLFKLSFVILQLNHCYPHFITSRLKKTRERHRVLGGRSRSLWDAASRRLFCQQPDTRRMRLHWLCCYIRVRRRKTI